MVYCVYARLKKLTNRKVVTLFGGELVMIKLKMSIEDISEYQTVILPIVTSAFLG